MMRKFTFFVPVALILSALPVMAQDTAMDIVDIAVADGRFTTLVAAVQAARLAETLSGDGPFTVFAPTNDTFAALPAGTVEGLLENIPALTDILLYHVVPSEMMAADVAGLETAATAQGSDIRIEVRDGSVFLNDTIQVVITDILASNGVIHVVDGVLPRLNGTPDNLLSHRVQGWGYARP